jgi:hypothetical protein
MPSNPALGGPALLCVRGARRSQVDRGGGPAEGRPSTNSGGFRAVRRRQTSPSPLCRYVAGKAAAGIREWAYIVAACTGVLCWRRSWNDLYHFNQAGAGDCRQCVNRARKFRKGRLILFVHTSGLDSAASELGTQSAKLMPYWGPANRVRRTVSPEKTVTGALGG